MAEQLDPNALVTLEELALSTMWETSALVELLERPQAASRHSDDPESAAQASLSSPPALRAPVGDALRHD